MRTQSMDTPPEIERMQIAGIRAFSPARRFALVCGISRGMMAATLSGASADPPPAQANAERAERFLLRAYGPGWASAFRSMLCSEAPMAPHGLEGSEGPVQRSRLTGGEARQRAEAWHLAPFDIQAVLHAVVAALDRLRIPYAVTGSVAAPRRSGTT